MKKRFSILLALATLLSALNINVSVSAEEAYKNFLTVNGDTQWTIDSNASNNEVVVGADGGLTITTTEESNISAGIGAACKTNIMAATYVAQYDVMLDYDNMSESENGYAAIQIFDGSYRTLISMYKNKISAQNSSSSTNVNCIVDSGKWYTVTVAVSGGVMQLYRKAAGETGLGEKLISNLAMKANTTSPTTKVVYAYTQSAKNICVGFKNIVIDNWSTAFPEIKATTESTYSTDFSEQGEWSLTANNGIAAVEGGLLKLKENNVDGAKPQAALKLNECDYPTASISYKMNVNSSGRMIVRFEDIGYRAFMQISNSEIKFCNAASTVGTTLKVTSAVGTQYDLRLEINSVDHTYSLLRKTGTDNYMYIIKNQPMQTQATTAKKLVIGIENDKTLDVQIDSVSVEYRNYQPVYGQVYSNTMDSSEVLADWTKAGEDGLSYEACYGVTLKSDGDTYKPSIQKTDIALCLPMKIEFDYTNEELAQDAYLGIQLWNGTARGFIQLLENKVRVQVQGASSASWNDYTSFVNTVGDTYTYRIVVGDSTYSVYRKAKADADFAAIAENVKMPTGHTTNTKNLKFYAEKAGTNMTIANLKVEETKEFYVDTVDTIDGIAVKYICQDKAAEGGKLYVAVYDGNVLKYVEIKDTETDYAVENKVLIDYDVKNGENVKAFIWRDMTPIAIVK